MHTDPGWILQPAFRRTPVVGSHGQRGVIFIVPHGSRSVLRWLRRHDELGTNTKDGLSLTF